MMSRYACYLGKFCEVCCGSGLPIRLVYEFTGVISYQAHHADVCTYADRERKKPAGRFLVRLNQGRL